MASMDRRYAPNFTGSARYAARMIVFVGIVAVGAALLFPFLADAFMANAAINGLIVAVFLIGVVYVFQQVFSVQPAANWIRKFEKEGGAERIGRPPTLIAPMHALLSEQRGRLALSSASSRAILDSVGARVAEAGEITRYAGRLLIFLGLLGTFYGLLKTVGAVGDAVSALSESTTGSQADVVAMMAALREPVQGMGTAFASSLFGLAGSLILGFLDLQASQAQNRFYNEVEEWLAVYTRLSSGGPAVESESDGGAPAYLGALIERMSDNVEDLSRTVQSQGGGGSAETAGLIRALDDRLARQERALERIADEAERGRQQTTRELKAELRMVARVLAAAASGDEAAVKRAARDAIEDREA